MTPAPVFPLPEVIKVGSDRLVATVRRLAEEPDVRRLRIVAENKGTQLKFVLAEEDVRARGLEPPWIGLLGIIAQLSRWAVIVVERDGGAPCGTA